MVESIPALIKLAGLVDKLVKVVTKIKSTLDERKVRKDLEESIRDAQRAFYACVPRHKHVRTDILNTFFNSSVFESQCQNLLEGQEIDLDLLEQAFYESGYAPGSLTGFEPRSAIAEFFEEFTQSAGRKESFAGMNIRRILRDSYRRRYSSQLINAYRNLRFAGIPHSFDQNPVRLEDIFITLQGSHRIPEVDILAEEEELLEAIQKVRHRPEEVRQRETVESLSLTEALKGNDKMVILGAPGSGKTTFMRYLALTFAQELSSERLGVKEDRIPVLITIQDIVEDLSSDNTIADILSKHINSDLQLDLPDGYFLLYLEQGRCIVLFDGLDEVASVRQRGEVAEKVRLFANLYNENRYIITSRIAGYREIQRLPESDFAHVTIKDLDDDQIRDFAGKWYEAMFPFEAGARAQDLVEAIERSSKVKQLAINPLMLTIMAVVHRSSAELPNERIKLYDLCTDALLFTWQRERGRPRLTDIQRRLIPDNEVRRRLEQLAYWMHSQAPKEFHGQMHVRYARLCSEMAEQLIQRRKMDPDEAEAEAEHFLEYIRQNTGVLLERGTELYAFVHLTFQEYFAAWNIYRLCRGDADKVWDAISPCLHDSHWREVILLLIAKLDDQFDGIGEELIGKILDAETPYDHLLKRNLLLAGACLADDVVMEAGTYEKILDEIVDMSAFSPYSLQRENAREVSRDLLNSYYKDNVTDRFLRLLSDESSDVRGIAASALGSIGKADDRVVDKLAELLSDSDVQMSAASALGSIGKADDRVVGMLVELLSDESSSVRGRAASALGMIGKADDRVAGKLVELLSDEDSDVRGSAASALGMIGKADDRAVDKLVELLSDESSDMRLRAAYALVRIGKADDRVAGKLAELLSDSNVRWIAAYVLGKIGKADDRVVDKLVELLSDEDSYVRGSAASALGMIGKADDRAVDKLAELLSDESSDVRGIAASALGSIGKGDDRAVDKLVELLSDEDSDVRGSAASALGSIGKADDRAVDKLAELLSDESSSVRGRAASALGRIGKADDRVAGKLAELLSDEDSDVRMGAADALGSIGKADDRAVDKLAELLSDEDSDVRGRAADALGSIGKADDRIIGKLAALLSDESSDVRGRAAYALVRIGILDQRVMEFLKGICEDYKKYDSYVEDPENEGQPISISDWAFQTLWRSIG